MRKTIMAIVAAIVVGFTMTAKAATEPSLSVKVDGLKNNVAVTGDTVTVNVTINGVDKNVTATEFKVSYDKTMLQYVADPNNTSLIANDDLYTDGTFFVYASATGTKTFALKFKVIGKSGNVSVGVKPDYLATGETTEETYNTVAEKKSESYKVSTTAPSTKPSTNNKKPAASTTTTKKKPTKYDQTGVNVLNYVGVVGLIAAAAVGTVALKKCKNN